MKNFLTMVFVLFALMASSSQIFASDEVKLMMAKSSVSAKYGVTWQYSRFDLSVENLAYDKKVSIHLKSGNGQWQDIDCYYVASSGNNREIWRADFKGQGDIQFVAKYQANGNTYWDNNHGVNYSLGENDGVLLTTSNVYNYGYSPVVKIYSGYNKYNGTIALKNLSYDKEVKIVYTTDNWATEQEVIAEFAPYYWYGTYSNCQNPSILNTEIWSFELDIADDVTELEYAIGYTANGETFWDNNNGENYKSTIEVQ